MEQQARIHNAEPLHIASAVAEKIDWGVQMMGAPDAWKKTKGKGVKVAVLDTGIDMYHPDLLPNIKGGINFTGGAKGFSDYQDRNGHGTHCAGIIAGCDNDQGIIGIAPEADLYAVKVLGDEGSGGLQSIMNGINWCITNEMDVISMSFGMESIPPEVFHEVFKAARQANIPVVVAAGNENHYVGWPAAYPEVIAVGAIDPGQRRASFSNFGKELDIAAPGVNIYSTYPVGQYAVLSGTSMATPMIAGAVALYIAHQREMGKSYTVAEIEAKLQTSAKDLGLAGYDTQTGYGLLDLTRLLSD